MKYSRLLKNFFLLIIFLFSVAFPYTVLPNNGENGYVLIINSYTESNPWTRIYTTPIYEQVVTNNGNLSAYTENMNVLLMKTEKDVELYATYLSNKYTDTPPSLIVLLGNSAYVLLQNELKLRWGKDIPFLVCVEKDFIAPREYYLSKEACPENQQTKLEEIVKEFHNLTALYVPEYISETIELMKKSIPGMNKLFFLADKRYISMQNKSFVQQIIQEKFPDIQLKLITAGEMTRGQLVNALQKADEKTGILFYSWTFLSEQGNQSLVSSETHRMLTSYTKKPIFTLNDMDIVANGMVGGYFYPKSVISDVLVDAINNILNGKAPNTIIIPNGPRAVLNYPVAEQKHLPLDEFSADTLFYMKPPTFWEQYHNHVYASGTILLIVMITLFFRISTLNKQRIFQAKEIAFMKSYKRLINSMPIGYMKQRILYKDGFPVDYEIVEVNPEFENLFKDTEACVGKKGSELHPAQLSHYMQACHLILTQGTKLNTQYSHKKIDKHLNTLITSSSTSDCVDIFMTDITELVKTQHILHTVNKKLSMSLHVANVTPWKWDLVQQTILCDINKTVDASFSGLFEENQLVVPANQYFAKIYKEDRQRVEKAYEALISGRIDKVKEEYRIYKPGKGIHEFEWVEAYATVEQRDECGQPTTLIGSTVTISDRKKVEEELLKAKNKAEEANKLKSAFLANMSHEIRTPLNAIIGFSNILATSDNLEEKEEYIQIIENNNTLLLQLINDILDLSKIEAGTLDFVYTDINVNSVLSELQVSLQSRISNRVQLIFEQKQEDFFVSIAKNRFLQVIINLITNAIKFTEEGSIRFGYSILNEEMLHFYVSDTGCGIAPEKIDSIFKRFVKLNAFAQGTGLGLSICQMIVEHGNGKIWVESEVGKGSTFSFTFPYKAATSPVREEKKFQKKKIEKDQLTVLIAEDNAGNFKLFESILKQEYKILHAWNGQEAIELFSKHNPHIVLMDINMPEMDGYEATKEIRKLSADVPIIAVTAYAFASDEEQIRNSGFNDYASKPLNANILKRKMINLLEKRLLF